MKKKLVCLLAASLLSQLALAEASSGAPLSAYSRIPKEMNNHRGIIPTSIRNVATRLLRRKIDFGEVTSEVAREALSEWLRSGAKFCPSYLPAPYFCPRQQTIWSKWGVGYALTWHGRVPGAWTSSSSPRSLVYSLTPGVPYWLTCFVHGDTAIDGGIVTNLWYQLRSGSYVNDGWFETGTNSVIPGVRPC